MTVVSFIIFLLAVYSATATTCNAHPLFAHFLDKYSSLPLPYRTKSVNTLPPWASPEFLVITSTNNERKTFQRWLRPGEEDVVLSIKLGDVPHYIAVYAWLGIFAGRQGLLVQATGTGTLKADHAHTLAMRLAELNNFSFKLRGIIGMGYGTHGKLCDVMAPTVVHCIESTRIVDGSAHGTEMSTPGHVKTIAHAFAIPLSDVAAAFQENRWLSGGNASHSGAVVHICDMVSQNAVVNAESQIHSLAQKWPRNCGGDMEFGLLCELSPAVAATFILIKSSADRAGMKGCSKPKDKTAQITASNTAIGLFWELLVEKGEQHGLTPLLYPPQYPLEMESESNCEIFKPGHSNGV